MRANITPISFMKRFLITLLFSGSFFIASAQTQEIKDNYTWGKIENGQKVGVWQYFDKPGELSLMVNYSTGKLTYIKPDTSKYLVYDTGEWVETHINTPPHFLGSHMELIQTFSRSIKYPEMPGCVRPRV